MRWTVNLFVGMLNVQIDEFDGILGSIWIWKIFYDYFKIISMI